MAGLPVTRPRLPGPRGPGQLRYLARLFREPQPVLDDLNEQFGGVCGLGFGPARMAVVGDPTALAELFATPAEQFRWGHKFNVLGFVVGEGSMIVSDGPDHHRRRASVQSAFSRRRLNGWIPTIVEQTDRAIDAMSERAEQSSEPIDLYPVTRRLVLDVVVRALFGERFAARAGEIGELFQRPQDYLESPAIRQFPHRIPFTRRARVRADRVALDDIIDREIGDRRANPSGDPLDVLDALVQDGSLTDAEIRDQVVTLIGAGYDTTSASLSWMLWCAALEPDVWRGLRAEADEVYGPLGTDGAARDHTLLSRLDLADRVMRESLRLHPAGVLSPREAAVDVAPGRSRHPEGHPDPVVGPPCGSGPERMVRPPALRPRALRGSDPRAEGVGRCGVGAVRPRREELHRVHARSDGTHADDLAGRPAPRSRTVGPRRSASRGHGGQSPHRRGADGGHPAPMRATAARPDNPTRGTNPMFLTSRGGNQPSRCGPSENSAAQMIPA